MTAQELIDEIRDHHDADSTIILCDGDGIGVEAVSVSIPKDSARKEIWLFPADVQTRIDNQIQTQNRDDPEPSDEDLRNLMLPDADLSEATEEIRHEKKKKFADIIANAMADMLGDHVDKDKRETIVEGYRELLGGLSSPSSPFPSGMAIAVPPIPPMPPSTYTEEINGRLTTIDFYCALSRTMMYSLNLETMQATLQTHDGHGTVLTTGQTKALFVYIRDISSNSQGYGFGPFIRKADTTFLSHPAVKAILDEMDARKTGGSNA